MEIYFREALFIGKVCAPLRQTRNSERILGRRTQAAPLSKRCPDTKLEPRNHFRKF